MDILKKRTNDNTQKMVTKPKKIMRNKNQTVTKIDFDRHPAPVTTSFTRENTPIRTFFTAEKHHNSMEDITVIEKKESPRPRSKEPRRCTSKMESQPE